VLKEKHEAFRKTGKRKKALVNVRFAVTITTQRQFSMQ